MNTLAADDQPLEEAGFRRRVAEQLQRMYRSRLADSIDSPDPLLEPQRGPGKFIVDDQTAPPELEIETFAGGVCREKNSRGSRDELTLAMRPLEPGEPTVQDGHTRLGADGSGQANEGVTIFGEHDRGLSSAAKQPKEPHELALATRGGNGRVQDGPQPRAFVRAAAQSWRAENRLRRLVTSASPIGLERQ
jgi:hypothetical protein